MVDSGACDHVCPPDFAPLSPIQETVASRAGKNFVGANGSKIRNLGRKDVTACTITGQKTLFKVQVADCLKNPILSVLKLEKSGNKVVFDDKGSYIYNRATNQYTPLRKHNGTYLIDMWVPHADPHDQLTGKVVAATLPAAEEPDKLPDKLEIGESVFARLPFKWE